MGILKWVVFGLGGFAFLITIVFSVMLLLSDPVDSTKKMAKTNQSNLEISKESPKEGDIVSVIGNPAGLNNLITRICILMLICANFINTTFK